MRPIGMSTDALGDLTPAIDGRGLTGARQVAMGGSMGIEKIPTRGVLGAVVAVGIMAVILVAVPAARWFLLITVPTGILVGVALYFLHRRSP
jgi:hypothetical protein